MSGQDFVSTSANQAVTYAPVGSKSSTSAPANCVSQTLNTYKAYWCTGLMTGLEKDTQYTYSVGGPSGNVSFTFTNEPTARPPIFAVYADFGLVNDESLNALYKDAKAGGFDAVIHAGVSSGAFNALLPLPAHRPSTLAAGLGVRP